MHNFKRICALLLTGCLVLGTAACGATQTAETTPEPTEPEIVTYTAKPGTVRKAETVYVNLDNAGKKTAVSVTDWLHTDKGEVAVSDVTNLTDVVDINGTTKPIQNGKNLTWNMASTDLYYKGTTDKQLPVEFSIEYKLNGKKISAQNIAGKSGDVEIHVTMKNTCEKDGIYLPVIAAGVTVFPEDIFSAIETENGVALGDGSKQIVLGMGVPGMAESLGLTESAKIGNIRVADSFTIKAKATNFELQNMYFAVIPICSVNLNTLIPGSSEEGKQFFSQIQDILGALGSMDMTALTDALSGDNIKALSDMLNDTITLYQKNKALLTVLEKYATKDTLDNIEKLVTALRDPKTVKMLEDLNNPLVKSLLRGMPELLDATQAMLPMMNDLQKDLENPEVQKALDELPQTLESLGRILDTLSRNSALLGAVENVAENDLVSSLASAVSSSDAESIIKDLTENADDILPQLRKYVEFGKSYKLYTDATDDMETGLMFIYMTPVLKANTEAAETTTAPELPWYKKLF